MKSPEDVGERIVPEVESSGSKRYFGAQILAELVRTGNTSLPHHARSCDLRGFEQAGAEGDRGG